MHEIGVAQSIVSRAEQHARKNGAQKVVRLTLKIGKLTGVVPGYLEKCWDFATQSTLLEGSLLEIEEIEGVLFCNECRCEFPVQLNLSDDNPKCPKCGSEQWHVKSGRELMIKEIGID